MLRWGVAEAQDAPLEVQFRDWPCGGPGPLTGSRSHRSMRRVLRPQPQAPVGTVKVVERFWPLQLLGQTPAANRLRGL